MKHTTLASSLNEWKSKGMCFSALTQKLGGRGKCESVGKVCFVALPETEGTQVSKLSASPSSITHESSLPGVSTQTDMARDLGQEVTAAPIGVR
jgi:hypothetical protein